MPSSREPVKKNLNSDQIARGRYHHGDLQTALIEAGEAVLGERGADGFSLRETARRAGVSPGAPAHHFGDARGLLTAIAARGFARLAQCLSEADAGGGTRVERVRRQGAAYVAFARANPASFDLMWRRAVLDIENADYREAGGDAFEALRGAVDGGPAEADASPAVYAAWAIVHGYARLMLDGALDGRPPEHLDQVLEQLAL